MNHSGINLHRFLNLISVWIFCVLAIVDLRASGCGFNAVVIINQNSSNSLALGNYYIEKRQVPCENVLRIAWAGSNVSWSGSEFTTVLLNPLQEMISGRSISNQIDYVVLAMDIPFQTILSLTNFNSTTSALFYGLKTDGGTDAGVTNSYAASEAVFYQAKPASALTASYLATMITGNTLADAKRMVDQGVAGDGKSPIQPVMLAKSPDYDRNIRYPFFDNAIFNVKVLGRSSILRTNLGDILGQPGLLGYETGLARYNITLNQFVPGAIADSLTSFGGVIFGNNDQTNLLAMIRAGASGSYGTVAEPQTNPQRFPDPQVYFYQARGFSLAECYYQSVNEPYLGLTVAEPLSAPFALPGSGAWGGGVSNSILTGIAPLTVAFSGHDSTRPLQGIDLFIDGKFHSEMTNVVPSAGDILTLTLNGYPITYTVPTNISLGGVAAGLVAQINTPFNTNVTKIKAYAHGDRIELQSFSTNRLSPPFYTTDVSSVATGATLRVKYLSESYPPRITPQSPDATGINRMQLEIPSALNYVVQASADLVNWSPIYTNNIPGLISFSDFSSPASPIRFYRVAGPLTNSPPKISVIATTNGGPIQIRSESQIGQPCAIMTSTNQLNWSPMVTNQIGGIMDYSDTVAANVPWKFYKAWIVPTPSPSLTMTSSVTQQPLIRIDNAALPYTIEYCTNGWQWLPVLTNFSFRDIQVETGSFAVSNAPTTYLNAGRPAFMNSEAYGVQEYKIPAAPFSVGARLQFVVTKTNNQTITIGITNMTASWSATNLTAAFYSMINSHPGLQGEDGIVAEDFVINSLGVTTFTVRARSAGYAAANVNVFPVKSGLTILPNSAKTLTKNIADLQPRNHLYVTAGKQNLGGTFAIDTTTLPDGYHELTAVAYEGSHVATQTRAVVPVQIKNTSLVGSLMLLDMTNTVPVGGTYHIQVTANTNTVSLIKLYSTGGVIGTATNTSVASFVVVGTNLFIGQHPFYATLETSNGEKYRTKTEWVRLE